MGGARSLAAPGMPSVRSAALAEIGAEFYALLLREKLTDQERIQPMSG